MVDGREAQLAALWEAIQSADFDHASEFYNLDAEVNLSGLKLQGRAAVRKHMESFRQSFPDVKFAIQSRHSCGDTIIEEWSCSAKHSGDFLGKPASGESIQLRAASVYEFEGDAIARERSYMDMSRTMVKTGVLVKA